MLVYFKEGRAAGAMIFACGDAESCTHRMVVLSCRMLLSMRRNSYSSLVVYVAPCPREYPPDGSQMSSTAGGGTGHRMPFRSVLWWV